MFKSSQFPQWNLNPTPTRVFIVSGWREPVGDIGGHNIFFWSTKDGMAIQISDQPMIQRSVCLMFMSTSLVISHVLNWISSWSTPEALALYTFVATKFTQIYHDIQVSPAITRPFSPQLGVVKIAVPPHCSPPVPPTSGCHRSPQDPSPNWLTGSELGPNLICLVVLIEGSLEVKLPTIWRDEKAVSREKSQKRKDQKKENAGARKGRKVAKHFVFSWFCGSGGSKSRLAKAAGATSGEMRDEKLHAVVARSGFRSEKVQNTSAPDQFWKLRCWKSAWLCGVKHIWK